MSYHRALGLPTFTPTAAFAEAVDPYSGRFSPRGTIYSPYGWGPDFNIGMPMNYTHHIGYERTPIPGARRVGPMYDQLSGYSPRYRQIPFTNRDDVHYAIGSYGIFDGGGPVDGNAQSLGGVLAVM
jgi:hypothetical protein